MVEDSTKMDEDSIEFEDSIEMGNDQLACLLNKTSLSEALPLKDNLIFSDIWLPSHLLISNRTTRNYGVKNSIFHTLQKASVTDSFSVYNDKYLENELVNTDSCTSNSLLYSCEAEQNNVRSHLNSGLPLQSSETKLLNEVNFDDCLEYDTLTSRNSDKNILQSKCCNSLQNNEIVIDCPSVFSTSELNIVKTDELFKNINSNDNLSEIKSCETLQNNGTSFKLNSVLPSHSSDPQLHIDLKSNLSSENRNSCNDLLVLKTSLQSHVSYSNLKCALSSQRLGTEIHTGIKDNLSNSKNLNSGLLRSCDNVVDLNLKYMLPSQSSVNELNIEAKLNPSSFDDILKLLTVESDSDEVNEEQVNPNTECGNDDVSVAGDCTSQVSFLERFKLPSVEIFSEDLEDSLEDMVYSEGNKHVSKTENVEKFTESIPIENEMDKEIMLPTVEKGLPTNSEKEMVPENQTENDDGPADLLVEFPFPYIKTTLDNFAAKTEGKKNKKKKQNKKKIVENFFDNSNVEDDSGLQAFYNRFHEKEKNAKSQEFPQLVRQQTPIQGAALQETTVLEETKGAKSVAESSLSTALDFETSTDLLSNSFEDLNTSTIVIANLPTFVTEEDVRSLVSSYSDNLLKTLLYNNGSFTEAHIKLNEHDSDTITWIVESLNESKPFMTPDDYQLFCYQEC